jgi:hypothetical protein
MLQPNVCASRVETPPSLAEVRIWPESPTTITSFPVPLFRAIHGMPSVLVRMWPRSPTMTIMEPDQAPDWRRSVLVTGGGRGTRIVQAGWAEADPSQTCQANVDRRKERRIGSQI